MAPDDFRHRLSAALAAASCGLAIAACGSSGGAGGTGTTGRTSHYASFLKFSTCMRSHGVSGFPDPSSTGGILLRAGPGSGIDPGSPSFQSAQQACRKLLPGGGPPRTVSEAQRRAAIANAQCIRTHGVPNFPDPTFGSGGGIRQQIPTGIDPQSPAFQKAARACGNGHFGP